MALFHSLLWPSSISLYMYVCHIFFTHSSANGHLCYFHVLAIVNSAVMNIGLHISLWIIVLSRIIFPGVNLPDHMVILFLAFWGTSILSSMVGASTCIPTSSVGGFPFLHTLSKYLFVDFEMMVILTLSQFKYKVN